MNVHSICSKKLDLFSYVSAHHYGVIVITVTFLDPSIDNSVFALNFYTTFKRDHNNHSGRVMVLVRHNIPVSRCFDLETGCEIQWL